VGDPARGVPTGTPNRTVYLYPTSVVAVHEELRDVIDLEWGIENRDCGRRELVVQDPSGYFLTFAEDTGDEPTSA
jgi:hypothetical protein